MNCTFNEIKTVSGLGLTPARVNRRTGTVFLNKEIFPKLNKESQDFVLAHEKGHYCKQTTSEFAADMFAFNELAGKKEKSLKNIVKAISENLFINKIPEHQKRFKNIAFNALMFDYLNNNNTKAYLILNKMEAEQIKNLFINYLKDKSITSVEMLSDEEKEMYLTDFMMTPEMQNITIAEAKNQLTKEEYSDFGGFLKGLFKGKGDDGEKKPLFSSETKAKFKGIFNNIAGGLIAKLGKGLGFNPNVTAISNAVNPINDINSGKSNDNGGTSQPESTKKTTKERNKETSSEDAKKEKKKQIMIFVSIGLLIIGIGLALYFGLRSN